MLELAAKIERELETLTDRYDRLLRGLPGYAEMEAEQRRETARDTLQLVVLGLKKGDLALFEQSVHATAAKRIAQGFEIEAVQQAVAALAEVLEPLLESVETANFLWKVLIRVSTGLSEMMVAKARRAEERFRRMAEVTQDGITILEKGRVVYINDRLSEILGYSKEELAKMNILDIAAEEERDRLRRVLQAIEEESQSLEELEFWAVRKDGARRYLRTRYFLQRAPQGGYNLFIFISDATERRRLEEQVHRSLQRRTQEVHTATEIAQEIAAAPALDELYRRVVTLIKERFGYYHAQIFRHDSQRGVMAVVAGYGEIGAKMKAAGHHLPYGKGVVGTAAATGEPILASDVRRDPNWVPHPDLPDTKGELAVPIKLGNRVLGVLDVQSDTAGALDEEDLIMLLGLAGQIATAIQSTQAMEEAAIFRRFVETSAQGFGMATLEGCITYINPTLARLLGVNKPENAIGQTFTSFYPPEVRQLLREEVIPTVMETGRWSGELTLLSAQGQLTPTLETFFLIRDDRGDPLYLADIVTDITERKRTESEMQEALRELERLTRTMSREGWVSWREATERPSGYLFDRIEVREADDLWLPEIAQAVEQKAPIRPGPEIKAAAAVAPLTVRGEIIGAIGVYDDPKHPLSPQELALVEQVSEQVAQALESARLFEQVQATLRETEALYRAGRQINAAQNLDDLLLPVLDYVRPMMDVDRCLIALLENPDAPPEHRQVVVEAVWDKEGQEAASLGQRFTTEQFPRLAELGAEDMLVIADVATSEEIDEPSRAALQQQGVGAAVIIPLAVGDLLLGWLLVETLGRPHTFPRRRIAALRSLAGQVAVALQNLRHLEEVRLHAEELAVLNELGRALTARLSVREVLEETYRQASRLVDTTNFFVSFYHPERQEFTAALAKITESEADRKITAWSADEGFSGYLLRHRTGLLLSDHVEEQIREMGIHRVGSVPKSWLGVPLIVGDRLLGTMAVASFTKPGLYTEHDRELLTAIANTAAIAIQNARLLEEAQARAERERLARTITDRVRRSADRQAILQTALTELGQMLGVSTAVVRLGTPEQLLPEHRIPEHEVNNGLPDKDAG